MATREVTFVVYDSVITAMSLPGGMVWKWATQRRLRVENEARRRAPKRTGRLAAETHGFYSGSGRDHVTMEVSCTAPYALFVHEGTGPWIYPDGKWLVIGPDSRWPRPIYKQRVRGQAANPFLADALEAVMDDVTV